MTDRKKLRRYVRIAFDAFLIACAAVNVARWAADGDASHLTDATVNLLVAWTVEQTADVNQINGRLRELTKRQNDQRTSFAYSIGSIETEQRRIWSVIRGLKSRRRL